jgi:O-antigen/teichoic acid export membrane protein
MNITSIQRQSVIFVISTITLTIVGFVSTIYFAHVLGPAPLGAYFLFLAYFGILNLVGDGGFGGAAVKRISEERSRMSISPLMFL